MFRLRVTTPQGETRVIPLRAGRAAIGRDADNDVALVDDVVSGHHCKIELVGSSCVLTDLGSSNGTWLNNARLQAPTPVDEQSRIYVGSHLIELEREAATATSAHVAANLQHPLSSGGAVLRQPEHRRWRDLHDRYFSYAKEWDERHRPDRLALRKAELLQAQQWLKRTPPHLLSEITGLQREFIRHSEQVVRRRATMRLFQRLGIGVLVMAILAGAVAVWPLVAKMLPAKETPKDATEQASAGQEVAGDGLGHLGALDDHDEDPRARPSADMEDGNCGEYDENDPDRVCVDVNQPIKHLVIPFETLEDIARRYDVSVSALADWNLLNPDELPPEGTTLVVRSPGKRPLPQTKIEHVVESGETWTSLSHRFGIPAQRLRDYNPGKPDLERGAQIAVWLDPKPYKPRNPDQQIPEFYIDPRAQSVGQPDNGALENGIQMPESDLYTLRNGHIMYGSALTIASLQKAVAMFRRDVDYDGIVMLADISKKNGGKFDPHKSHQAGRDIDIWLPTLKGVYLTKDLGEGKSRFRKPHFPEVDWYATWGLVRALIQTEVVEYVFLDWRYQKFVYDAAVNMGATPEQLDAWIQYPRHQGSSRAIFRHSQDHLSHIHVRFKCASWEDRCKGSRAVE